MITIRTIIISLILIIFLSVWTIYTEHFVGSINSISPPPGAIFIFFFVVLINSLLSFKKLNLRSSELVLIYSLLLVSAPISSFAVTRFFVSILVAPFYFATPEVDEDMTKLYRFALAGFMVALFFLIWWFVYVGIKPFVIIGFLVLFLIYSLSVGRVRTEAGLGAVSGPVRMDDFLKSAIGTKRIGVESLTVLAYLRWVTVDLRGFMSAVPAQLESFKMVGKSNSLRRVPILIFSSVTVALLVSVISLISISYHSGVYKSDVNGWWILAGPQETFEILRRNILNLQGADWTCVEFVLLASVVTCIMAYLRTKFLWFPLHPIGYAVGFSRLSMDWVWFSVLIGWGLKLCVIKYGGLKLNHKVIPLSLGFILGDFFMAGFWSIIGSIFGKILYQIFP